MDRKQVGRVVEERRRRLAGADWGGVGRGVLLVVVGIGMVTLSAPVKLLLLAAVVVLAVDMALARRARHRRLAVVPADEHKRRRLR